MNITETKRKKICDDYESGIKLKEIKQKYDVSSSTIYRFLRQENISKRGGRGPDKKYSKEEIEKISEMYSNGHTTVEIAEQFSTGHSTICYLLRENGYETKGPREAHRYKKCNDSAFSTLDSETEYWIGFLMADGCVFESGKMVVALKNTDRGHLAKFKNFLDSEHKIMEVNDGKAVRFSVRRPSIVNDLEKYGVVPNKSLIANIKNETLKSSRNFWRGMVDGDGRVAIRENGQPLISLFGTKSILYDFKSYVSGFSDTNTDIYSMNSIFSYRVLGKYAPEIIKKIYDESNIFLDRKMKVAKEII